MACVNLNHPLDGGHNAHLCLAPQLTATFADNCLGLSQEESNLAHDASILPNGLNPEGRFAQKWCAPTFYVLVTCLRGRAQVQSLDVVEQLNAGVRSIDFRMIWTAPDDRLSSYQHDWYVNHRVQSNQTALWYLARIRDWMISHPGEVL